MPNCNPTTPTPPGLADKYRLTARRLFGIRSENYEIAEEMPALLLARDVREHEGLSDEDAALVGCDIFPAADHDQLLELLRGTTPEEAYVEAGQVKRALHGRLYDEGRADGLAGRERRRKHRAYRLGFADGSELRTDRAFGGRR